MEKPDCREKRKRARHRHRRSSCRAQVVPDQRPSHVSSYEWVIFSLLASRCSHLTSGLVCFGQLFFFQEFLLVTLKNGLVTILKMD
jgi:hypothetical protein